MADEQILGAQSLGPEPTARLQMAAKAAGNKAEKGRSYRINTTPYYSTAFFAWQITADQLPAAPAAPQIIFAKLVPQAASAFHYRIGDTVGDSQSNVTKKATRADTNITEPYQTVADEDCAFEGIELHQKTARIVYADGNIPATLLDTHVRQALGGQIALIDPAAIVLPGVIGSPFNLQNNLDQAMRQNLSVNLMWGGKTNVPLGTTDYLHDATANSYLRAAGTPAAANLFKQSEGHNWEGQGADSQLEVQFHVEEPVVMGFSPCIFPGAALNAPTKPAWIIVEYKVTLRGVAFRPLGRNG